MTHLGLLAGVVKKINRNYSGTPVLKLKYNIKLVQSYFFEQYEISRNPRISKRKCALKKDIQSLDQSLQQIKIQFNDIKNSNAELKNSNAELKKENYILKEKIKELEYSKNLNSSNSSKPHHEMD